MRKISMWAIALIFVSSCAGESSEETSGENEESVEETDTVAVEEVEEQHEALEFDGEPYTTTAVIDGPDEWLYIKEAEEGVSYDYLKIIPESWRDDPDEAMTYMLSFVMMNFHLYSYENHNGGVMVYYDENATKLMTAFNCSAGKPNGKVTVFKPDGTLLLARLYRNGEWEKSFVEPAAVDWSFNQSESALTINDTTRAYARTDSGFYVHFLPTHNYESGSENTQYTVMQKESFNNPFTINGDVFTGTLVAYWDVSDTTLEKHFELTFKDGWLDGEIFVYNDWNELALHERFENGELVETIYVLEYGDGVAKPIIYFYPEEEMDISVNLHFNGRLTSTYPKYEDGWKVHAKEDGTLTDEDGKEYYALYWEGEQREDFTLDEGFVIKGSETAEFLEKSLDILGLNRREANEFIVYWLPRMEGNEYNLIHFSTEEYERNARLVIDPQPETLIRVMMVYKPLDHKESIPMQDLTKLRKERKGFTVVEWGGSEVGTKLSM